MTTQEPQADTQHKESTQTQNLQVVNKSMGDGRGNTVQAGVIKGNVNAFFGTDASTPEGVPVFVTTFVSGSLRVGVDGPPPVSFLASPYIIDLVVEGRSAQAVILKDIRPVVLARRVARPARMEALTASALDMRSCDILFDHDPPRLAPEKTWLGRTKADFPFTVTSSDPEAFRLTPRATRHEIEWKFELDWICGGRTGSLVIDNKGKPFTVHPGLPQSDRCI